MSSSEVGDHYMQANCSHLVTQSKYNMGIWSKLNTSLISAILWRLFIHTWSKLHKQLHMISAINKIRNSCLWP